MNKPKNVPTPVELAALRTHLVSWLIDSAYPLWARNGIDARSGGFIETLAQNGDGLSHPRRARVHPRQIWAFARATELGWQGDVPHIVHRGMTYFTKYYQRSDKLFRTLADADGVPLDDRAVLYDQAFALLGYSAAATALDSLSVYEQRAIGLRHAIEAHFRAKDGAFHSTEFAGRLAGAHFESNPHMHLLEACLAWAQIGNDLAWNDWARDLIELALRKFIRRGTGALGEAFGADWEPAPGVAGRIIEPGHQYEWAWLLLRSESRHPDALRAAALRLIAIGEGSGVHNQVAINALLDDFSIHDANARFWPQTERLKAALLAARLTGDAHYGAIATAAAASIVPYLKTPVAGLWLDVQLPSGDFVESHSPASTFYHLVGGIAALDEAVRT